MNGGSSVLVLYKVANSGTDHGHYNAFYLPRGGGVTLATVKKHCLALRGLNHVGADGYHWRVRVDEKTAEGSSNSAPQYSWWDIQDENAKLPVKEASSKELERMFSPPDRAEPSPSGASDDISKVATGALRSLGKAVHKVAGTTESSSSGQDFGPRVPVIAFKLLDLVQMEDSFLQKHRGGGGRAAASLSSSRRSTGAHSMPRQRQQQQPQSSTPVRQAPPARVAAPSPRVHQQQQQARVGQSQAVPRVHAHAAQAAGARQQQQRHQQVAGATVPKVAPPGSAAANARRAQQQQQQTVGVQRARVSAQQQQPPSQRHQEASLMDFGDVSPKPTLHHMTSSPATFAAGGPGNETRAQKLKREYAQKEASVNRVWDDVDQRWVEVEAGSGPATQGSTSAPPGAASAASMDGLEKKVVGISLDASNAIGKSASVQAAVHQRVSDMKMSQQKALEEVRDREMKKKESEAEEDEVRKRLEPMIKAWSEEHGQKKQLRALLASLHTILWPDAGWTQVSLGDLLNDAKCKKFYHKATLKVHPDKTHHLDAEKRFLAKRIFDALTQAKVEFDEGKN